VSSLAAARLGMLTANENANAEMQPPTDVFEAINAFDWEEDVTALEGDDAPTDVVAMIARSKLFRGICILAIIGNTIYIGASADRHVRNSYRHIDGLEREADWHLPDLLFTCWFTMELILRMLAEKRSFFYGNENIWNFFDMVLVINSLLEQIFQISANLTVLSILRVFRLIRVELVVCMVKALKSLRTMVYSMLNTFVALMWAFVMILMILFIFCIIFNNGAAAFFETIDVNDAEDVARAKEVHLHFGSLYETMITLFCSITGGDDWMNYGKLVKNFEAPTFYFNLFCFYVGFCVVGLLNVVTGVFVDQAVCTRTQDEVVEPFTEDQKRTSEEVRRIFKKADTDKSGSMSFDELHAHLKEPWVKAYFSGLEIDPSEARIIFTLMDSDGSGCVSIDEFIDGTMKLKGRAKNVDVLSMMFDHVRFSYKFHTLCRFVEDQLYDMREATVPGSIKPKEKIFPHLVEETMCGANSVIPALRPIVKQSSAVKNPSSPSRGGSKTLNGLLPSQSTQPASAGGLSG